MHEWRWVCFTLFGGLSYLTLVTVLFTDDSVCFPLFPDGSPWFYYALTTEMC